MAGRYILPALAIASGAAAAVCSGTTTISSQAQATQVATCNQFNGNIVIASGTVGDIDLSGIQRLEGSLIAKNVPKLTSLSASTLSIISNSFTLNTISSITSLSFPSLVAVDQIVWQGLPSLQGLSFTQQVQKASVLNIQNTNLATLEGIDLQIIDTLYLANNPFLTDVSMQLGNVSNFVVFSSNGNPLNVEFPNLMWANDLLFQNISTLSIPSLAAVNGSISFRNNYMESLSAPNLTVVGSSLSFISNNRLSTLSFPELTGLGGGLGFANNSQLTTIAGFPRLSKVYGAIDFYGVFTSASLPSLEFVRGAFNAYSTKVITNTCSHFKALKDKSEIRGLFSCQGEIGSAGTSGTHSTGSEPSGTSSSGSSSTGKSAANSVLIPYATGFIGIVAAIFGML